LIYAASPNSGLAQSTATEGQLKGFDAWKYATNESNAPYAWPSALPGDRHVLFTDVVGRGPDESGLRLLTLADRNIRTFLNGGTYARYSAGHVFFARAGALYALPFDADRLEPIGPETKVIDDVVVEPNGAGQYAVSPNGTLAYVAGRPVTREFELVWVNREGRTVETVKNDGREYSFPRLSPDSKQLAVTIPIGSNYDVWILYLESGNDNKVTDGIGEDFEPVWHPDGSRLAISSEHSDDDGPALAWMGIADRKPEFLLRTPGIGNWEFPTSWSPDGKWLAFTRNRSGAKSDVELMPTSGAPVPIPFAAEAASESGAMFNPKAPLVAYVSDKSGNDEVYVRPFPGQGPDVPASTGGGTEPVWSRDGRELFYRQGNSLWSARLTPAGTFERAVMLFETSFEPAPYGGRSANYDVSLDGQRFLIVRRKPLPKPATIQIVLDWPRALIGRSRTR
jgi:serine/threonine-protein kinase